MQPTRQQQTIQQQQQAIQHTSSRSDTPTMSSSSIHATTRNGVEAAKALPTAAATTACASTIIKLRRLSSKDTADQFSSSLASIASASNGAMRQALHHQQQSSSSATSSSDSFSPAVVTAVSANNNSSGEDRESSGGDAPKKSDAPAASSMMGLHHHHHHHHHHLFKKAPPASSSLSSAKPSSAASSAVPQLFANAATSATHYTYGLPLTVADDTNGSAHNSNNSNSATTTTSSKKKKKQLMLKQQPPPCDDESDSSGDSTVPVRHHHKRHHHHQQTPHGSSKAVARKKRPHPSSSSSMMMMASNDVVQPHVTKQQRRAAAAAATEAATEDDNSSSGSGTEAGYDASADDNNNKGSSRQGSPSSNDGSNSSSDMPYFSSDDMDVSLDEGHCKQPMGATTASAASVWANAHLTAAASLKPPPPSSAPAPGDAKLPAKPKAIAMSSSSIITAVAKSHFAKVSRPSARTANRKVAPKISRQILSLSGVAASSKRQFQLASTPNSSSHVQLHQYGAISNSSNNNKNDSPPILSLGSDLMAHVLTFLEPPDILQVLTMPLSKEWQATFAGQQELWRVLCLLEPFKAQVDEGDFASSSSSSSSCSEDEEGVDADDDGSLSSSFSASHGNSMAPTPPKKHRRSSVHHVSKLGKYRLLFTSFVRCMKYLARIKEDVLHGRPPSMIDYGGSSVMSQQDMGSNRSLQQFLAGARDVVESQRQQQQQQQQAPTQGASLEANQPEVPPAAAAAANMPILSADDGSHSYQSSVERRRKRKMNREQSRRKRPKFGHSMLTDRLLAPAANGEVNPENVTLPWSCALYSIVNWMVAFTDVEGIQIMCLKVLPLLLEDEQQRITAQRVGLTDVILRGMVLFPNSVHLHTASFHTLVLLARPLGGREGMLFHSSMVNAAGIFGGGGARDGGNGVTSTRGGQGPMFSGGAQNDGKSGIAVMLDSMRRFEDSEALQAMSCWSLVNIALAPKQKEVLVKLGGIAATTNAMMRHPHNAEVQFRALFALINLVIPSVTVENNDDPDDLDDVNRGFGEELDEMVDQITNLVVLAMKNFCSSEAILNRACLVLHNLSLTQGYHTTLLWTPNCYQMLEWCLANYRTDQVLQQSAAGTLHRLQVTLSNDEKLRARFAASIQAQQQLSLENARREAVQIYEQEQMRQGRQGRSSTRARGSTGRRSSARARRSA